MCTGWLSGPITIGIYCLNVSLNSGGVFGGNRVYLIPVKTFYADYGVTADSYLLITFKISS